jgi:maleylpyruvate isomerase
MTEEELDQTLTRISRAEERFVSTAAALTEEDLKAPSLCEGWTRGHVIAHVALNAHSIVNLMEGARTGRDIPQYPSASARSNDIERYSTRTPAEHAAALKEGSDAFHGAARTLPLDRWEQRVRNINGYELPASLYLFARLREVEIHHVDLDAGCTSKDWSDEFVTRVLEGIPDRLDEAESPFKIHATDLDLTLEVGGGSPVLTIEGPGHALLAWLLGRSEGKELDAGGKPLPALPAWG